ncbi:MAG: HIT family protein [Proteobacteria bacterium]|nr:HIT family protein [Pseudomonadota bacterium]
MRDAAPVPWSLDARLQADAVGIADLPLSRILVMKDANFPWLLLVPRIAAASDILDLSAADQARLMGEIARVAGALKTLTRCDRLNIAALGNVVAQLHVHVIARRRDDIAWPRPVWNHAPPLAYDAPALARFIAALRAAADLG